MELINQLINDLSSSTPISDILIKAKVLAHRLQLSELSEWIDHEIDGYPASSVLPDYRKIPCRVIGHVVVPGQIMKNYPLPLPPEIQKEAETLQVTQSISSLDDAAQGNNDKIIHQLPPETFQYLSTGIAVGRLIYAHREADKGHVFHIRTAIKSKLLNFLLKLSDEHLDNKIQAKQMTEFTDLFKNTFFGDNATIQVGLGNTQYVSNKISAKGNFEVAKDDLLKNGVDKVSIDELQEVIDDDTPIKEEYKFGPKVQAWMGKMFGKALDGSWKIGAAAAGKVLADVISNYYGW